MHRGAMRMRQLLAASLVCTSAVPHISVSNIVAGLQVRTQSQTQHRTVAARKTTTTKNARRGTTAASSSRSSTMEVLEREENFALNQDQHVSDSSMRKLLPEIRFVQPPPGPKEETMLGTSRNKEELGAPMLGSSAQLGGGGTSPDDGAEVLQEEADPELTQVEPALGLNGKQLKFISCCALFCTLITLFITFYMCFTRERPCTRVGYGCLACERIVLLEDGSSAKAGSINKSGTKVVNPAVQASHEHVYDLQKHDRTVSAQAIHQTAHSHESVIPAPTSTAVAEGESDNDPMIETGGRGQHRTHDHGPSEHHHYGSMTQRATDRLHHDALGGAGVHAHSHEDHDHQHITDSPSVWTGAGSAASSSVAAGRAAGVSAGAASGASLSKKSSGSMVQMMPGAAAPPRVMLPQPEGEEQSEYEEGSGEESDDSSSGTSSSSESDSESESQSESYTDGSSGLFYQ
ncbi:unnamed protein product [Amoebophrya sp. A120]|nr:unnamed protein product [Amoebophrya sp. A120]|eukprot:GSA120T00000810001.1